MPNKYAISNGDFTHQTIWSTSPSSYVATTVPDINDVASANTYFVTITAPTTTVGLLSTHTSTGLFVASGGNVINANISHSPICNRATLVVSCTGNVTINGNVFSSSGYIGNTSIINHTDTGTLNINGNITSSVFVDWTVFYCIDSSGRGNINIFGDLINSGQSSTSTRGFLFVRNSGNSNINIVSNVIRHVNSSPGIQLESFGSVNITANEISLEGVTSYPTNAINIINARTVNVTSGVIKGGVRPAVPGANESTIQINTSGPVSITSNTILSQANYALASTNTSNFNNIVANSIQASNSAPAITITSSNNKITCTSLFAAPNGRVPIFAPAYRFDPVPVNAVIRYARNGTGVGDEAYLYQFTGDVFGVFSQPPLSAVRAGVQYAGGALTGTCQIPPASAVAFGTQYDSNGSRLGLAFNSSNIIFSTPVSAINVPNSIGDRIKKAATIESVGHLVASFSN